VCAAVHRPAAVRRGSASPRRQALAAVAFMGCIAIVRATSHERLRGRIVAARRLTAQGEPYVITPAFAQTSASPALGGDLFIQIVPFVLIFVIMWFLIIRPQQKRVKSHQEMIKNVRRGDTVVTSGGIVGKVTKVVDDGEIEVEIADNVRVRIVRSMISEVRSKTEPVKAA
jgi:preprotein translocase subunit YajC